MQCTSSFTICYKASLLLLSLLFVGCSTSTTQQDVVINTNESAVTDSLDFDVLAYYTGQPDSLDAKTLNSLTHIIYSFAHLEENRLVVKEAADSASLNYLASLKKEYPHLKIMIALGGWGGCETCSTVFASAENRKAFAQSTKAFLEHFNLDGLDLDWEYPTIEGFPEHPYGPADRENFSLLVSELRQTLGWDYELSFAAGGFTDFLEKSVDWATIMPLLNRVNLMSYDLVNGNSTQTGHHTPLYSTEEQLESTHNAVQYLDSIGVDLRKIVIGAAFYARVWENVSASKQGLYQAGQFKESVPYHQLDTYTGYKPGFEQRWDSVAQAPYLYNPNLKVFATYDNPRSLAYKTRYALSQGLGGIMFWQLSGDTQEGELLQTIAQVKQEATADQ